MELGRLLCDIPTAEVFQLHREPQTWKWQRHASPFGYQVRAPRTRHKHVAINLSLSADIADSRIAEAMGKPHSVWTIAIRKPGNDFLRSRGQLSAFRHCFRQTLNRVKAAHGEDACVHLFPAVPVAVAVEIGRVWMPKADLPMKVYDQNRRMGGFRYALELAQD